MVTKVGNGHKIVWQVAPVDPSTAVAIAGFGGNSVNQQITPQQAPVAWGEPWVASTSIPPGTSGTQYQYTMTLQCGGPTGPDVQLRSVPSVEHRGALPVVMR